MVVFRPGEAGQVHLEVLDKVVLAVEDHRRVAGDGQDAPLLVVGGSGSVGLQEGQVGTIPVTPRCGTAPGMVTFKF